MLLDDIIIELARTERELLGRVLANLAAKQLGEAWIDFSEPEVERRAHEVAPPPLLITEPAQS